MDHERQARRLVLLFDGTGKTFAEEKQTNVAKLYDILMDNSNEQLCHYEVSTHIYIHISDTGTYYIMLAWCRGVL